MRFRVTTLAARGRLSLTLEAAHADDARVQAKKQGYIVLGVRPVASWLPGRTAMRFPLTLFSRELLALLGSGLTLVEALQTLADKEVNGEMRRLLLQVLTHLYEGESLSAAIARYPASFPPLYVASVHAAEKTSNLSEALSRYVAYQEQLAVLRKKVVSAGLYPALLVVVGSLVALFLLGWVVPRFSAIYAGNLESLPLASRLLMHWGEAIHDHAALAGSLILAAAFVGYRILCLPIVRAAISRQIWRLPGIGEKLRVFQLTRYYRTVGMLLSGGIPVVSALEMAEGLLHPELRVRLAAAARDIREGKQTSDAMAAAGLTTPVAMRMLRVGERSGRMGEMMEAIAAFHDEELERAVDWFTRLLEPLLMAAIGLSIGVIVVLLYLPIFDLAGSIE